MKREIFSPEHLLFRDQFRRFAKHNVEPKIAEWNARGQTDRESPLLSRDAFVSLLLCHSCWRAY